MARTERSWLALGILLEDEPDTPDDIDLPALDALSAIIEQRRPGWQDLAACREYPAEWWFPERGQSAEPAKEVCSRCLVAEECEAAGLEDPAAVGIWGGRTANNRKSMRRDVA